MTATEVVIQLENVAASLYWLGDACKEYAKHSENSDDITAVLHSYIDTVRLSLEATVDSINETIRITETIKTE